MNENKPYFTPYEIKKYILILIVANCFIGLVFLLLTLSGIGPLYEWFVNNGYIEIQSTNLSNITYIKIIE